jgi:hypothetical protein
VILCLGALVLIRGGSFTTRREILKVGDLNVSATEERLVPTWIGGVALIVGIVLIGAGTRQRP